MSNTITNMNDKDREAFEAWMNERYGHDQSHDWPRTHDTVKAAWQAAIASERARLIALLDGAEMVEIVAKAIATEENKPTAFMFEKPDQDWDSLLNEAQGAVTAIKAELTKGHGE